METDRCVLLDDFRVNAQNLEEESATKIDLVETKCGVR